MNINLGIQIVPILDKDKGFPIIDECIELIQESGINYTVTPFETILEGDYRAIMDLVNELYTKANELSPETVINIRIHTIRDAHVVGTDKTAKFNS